MSDWPNILMPPLHVITPWSIESINMGALTSISPPTQSAIVAQNQAYYYPFTVDVPCTAVKMFTVTGATQNGNIDVGIYDAEWNRLVSLGSTTQGTANTLQECDITDTDLTPGLYWMAAVSNSATATFFQTSQSDELILGQAPFYVQGSAFALPSTATPVLSTESAPRALLMGVSFETLI